jgi:hypothetical protein
MLLGGGLLTACFGVEGQMVLIDTPDPRLQTRIGLTNQGSTIYLDGVQQIDVFQLNVTGSHERQLERLIQAIDRGAQVTDDLRPALRNQWSVTFQPGSFVWHSDEYLKRTLPWELEALLALGGGFVQVHDLDSETKLTVKNYYPHAAAGPAGEEMQPVPRAVRPGVEATEPAIRCSLTVAGQTKDFWASQADRRAARLHVGGNFFLVRYRPATRTVDFVLTLQRARQRRDPGSDRPAAFESDVCLAYAHRGETIVREQRLAMNHTLDHGLFKIYQANYRQLIDPETERPIQDGNRPVSLSGLTVAHDPGLWFKYAGALVVVLGIATMFYMKAYFFKPRRAAGAAAHLRPGEPVHVPSESRPDRVLAS